MNDKKKEKYFKRFMGGYERGFIYFFDELYYPLFYFTKQLLHEQGDMENIICNSFIEMWNKRKETNFMQPGQVKNWLYRNVSNKISELSKSVNKEPVSPSEFSNAIIKAENIYDVSNTVNLLPELRRMAYISFFYRKNKVQSIADELGISATKVKSEIEKGISFVDARSIFKFQRSFKFNKTN